MPSLDGRIAELTVEKQRAVSKLRIAAQRELQSSEGAILARVPLPQRPRVPRPVLPGFLALAGKCGAHASRCF